MEGQAVTTNPWLIMAINMTVVFVVLILLGILMEIVHLVDPTKKKKAPKTDGISEISDRYVRIGKVYYLDYDKGELIKLEKNDGRGIFFALGEDYGKDFNLNAEGIETTRRYVYFKGKVLENADYDSFGIKYNDQKNAFEIRDKNRVYETLKNE